ncbi:MAG: M20/M25/M40 family metallo-hydrolase [Chloroflexota bacterium]
MTPSIDPSVLAAVGAAAHERAATSAFLARLADLVAIRSGTGDADGVERVAEVLGRELRTLGTEVGLRADGPAGPTLVGVLRGRAPGRRLALVGHLDTVGALDDPDPRLELREGRAFGRGVVDMKGGLLLVVAALGAIRRATGAVLPAGELLVIVGPDEEVGSPVGRVAMQELVPGCDAALVLEPGRPTGALVAARKGMLQARVEVRGRAAHAGVEPEAGRSALLAAAHATIALHAITGLGGSAGGVTVNVGTLRGGSRPNVVPADAVLELDLRAATTAAMEEAEAAIRAVIAAPAVPDVTMSLVETGRFPVMERLPATDALLARVAGVGAGLGLAVEGVATGGASDANLIASLGVPVLDGLGPVGGGMHGAHEFLAIDPLPDRIALLAGAILELTAA